MRDPATEVTNPDQPAGNPERGYWLNFAPDLADVLHDFCGKNDIAGALCAHCDRPFTRYLSLDANDDRLSLDLQRIPIVHLLYCWTCSVPFGDFSYKIEQDGSIKVLQLPPRLPDSEHGPDGPYDGYIGVFPKRQVSLSPISDEEQELMKDRWLSKEDFDLPDGLAEPRHQIGGYPFIYNAAKTVCPNCSEDMPLFAAICNDASGNNPWRDEEDETFVGNGGVQMVFHLCRDCSIVSAYSSCD